MDRTRVIHRLGFAAAVAWLAFGAAEPAAADPWNSFLGFVGMGPKDPADSTIDYSARPALVVPPKMDLPPPQTAKVRPADWPNDPDAGARHAAEADSRRPAPPSPDAGADASADADQSDQSAQPAQQSKADSPPDPGSITGDKKVSVPWDQNAHVASNANPNNRIATPWGGSGGSGDSQGWSLSNPLGSFDWFGFVKQDDSKSATALKVGVDPPRQYLTQPPPGYRAPVEVDQDSEPQQAQTSAASSVSSNAKSNTPDPTKRALGF
ncbi:MAG TPA: hypothetical protein VKV77_01905 [Methylovirgula sp.]|nr:hypothetical protein [Methylovirgula sp.]